MASLGFLLTVFSISVLLGPVVAQCSNNVAVYHPTLRTLTSNETFFIVPVPKEAVLKALKETYPLMALSLLDVPSADTSLFPNGFPDGMHPVRADIAYTDDIRMSSLQIDGPLLEGDAYALYVSKDGSPSPLAVSLNQYIAGKDGPLPGGLVPAVASALLFGGAEARLGQFRPDDAAYQSDEGGTISAQAKWAAVPNPVSGPGVYPEAVDMQFKTISRSTKYTRNALRYFRNQPSLLPSGKCQRNTYYWNNATALPAYRNGQVTLGPGSDGNGLFTSALMAASPDGSGVYTDVDGYSACTQNVGYAVEDCDQAAANLNPSSFL